MNESKVLVIEIRIKDKDDEASLFDMLEENEFEFKVTDER